MMFASREIASSADVVDKPAIYMYMNPVSGWAVSTSISGSISGSILGQKIKLFYFILYIEIYQLKMKIL